MAFDILLKNGEIYDGTGSPAFLGDVAVHNGYIAEITGPGALKEQNFKDVIDVTGLVVSPGFVDLHTHSDFTLIADGRAQSQVYQGVTTEVIGQCGISCAPVCNHKDIPIVSPWFTKKAKHKKWNSFGEYLNTLSAQGIGVNVVAFVGHGTVHRAVLGNGLKAGDPSEIKEMGDLVEKCFEEGAGGFSSGLEYFPGILSSPRHLIPLCEIAAGRDRLYATHVRNRDTHYDLGFAEAISTARQSGARLQISHIQPKFGAPSYAMEHTLEMLEAARNHDVDVAFDVIPHDWNHTLMAAILPKWAQAGSVNDILSRLCSREDRMKIKENPQPMMLIVKAKKWKDIILLNATENKKLVGANFEEIGQMRGIDPFDAVLDILAEESENMLSAMWSSKSFNDTDIEMCLTQPECAVISDTVAISNDGLLKDHIGSLSGYGWAARFLQHYVRDRKVIGLSEALRKITSIPAERLGLKDRGKLVANFHADISVFDKNSIVSNSTPKQPRCYATGVAHVLVNGQFAVRNGIRQPVNNGRVIREFN